MARDYYYHTGKDQGHYPGGRRSGFGSQLHTRLGQLICLEGADEQTYLKAERHLLQTGGIVVSARQIQRVVQRVGSAAHVWQERTAQPGRTDAPIMYVSADGTGVPMVRAELEGRRGKQPDGKAKTRQVYLGCVFTQHRTDEKGHPVRDWESTTYVSSFKSSAEFGPCLRQEAIRRGMGSAGEVVVLIDGAEGLENWASSTSSRKMVRLVQIVDFYHAVEHAGEVLAALIGKEHPDYKNRQHQWAKRLLKNKVRVLIEQTRQEAAGKPQALKVEEALGYFARNIKRMQYGNFRQGLLHRLRSGGGWLQTVDRRPPQAVGHKPGRNRALKTSWRCAVFTAAAGWKSFGKTASMGGRHITMRCRGRLNGRILSHTLPGFPGSKGSSDW